MTNECENDETFNECAHRVDPVNGERRCSCRPPDMNWCEECQEWLSDTILENGDVKECWEHTTDFETLWDVISEKNHRIRLLTENLKLRNQLIEALRKDLQER
ncbi:hypothetical protein, partial [Candidatus Magnetobacterium casense]